MRSSVSRTAVLMSGLRTSSLPTPTANAPAAILSIALLGGEGRVALHRSSERVDPARARTGDRLRLPPSIHCRLRNRLRTKGIDGFQAYRSRHNGITNWVRQGVEAPIVQQLAGHEVDLDDSVIHRSHAEVRHRRRVPLAFTAIYGRAV
ncbi:MAG: hypothetical protein ACRDF0_03330 [Candidatus Limnocylindria bacterium]